MVHWANADLAHILVTALRAELPRDTENIRFALFFPPVPDPRLADGDPQVRNLRSEYGYVEIVAMRHGRVVYRHPHSLRQLIAPVVRAIVERLEPAEREWGYLINTGRDVFGPSSRPEEGGAFVAPPPGNGPARTPVPPPFRIRLAEEPEFPVWEADERIADPTGKAPHTVLLSPAIARFFDKEMPLSNLVEDGGFLCGLVHRLPADDERDRYLLEIKQVVPAEHSGASLLRFTFTGDSFQAVHRKLDLADSGELLLGWYHTHLFAATNTMGLSQHDVDLHFDIFRRPWQLAGLINITDEGRLLRFYSRVGNAMRECPLWIGDERDGYRLARPVVDRGPADDALSAGEPLSGGAE